MGSTIITLEQHRHWFRSREASAKELTTAALDRIDRAEPSVKAYLTLCRKSALQQAEIHDRRLEAGEETGFLAGAPIAVKDNMCTDGIRTTCASRMLEDFIPPYDASVVTLLQAAGTVMVGKTNLDEFAMGSSTENSAFQCTCNPWDLRRVPGGSSGGSAAAVAAGTVPLALGSDTGGSIRQPASFCGVVGLKPTYGLVSRYGLIAFASSLDQIGPFTRTVTDSALALDALAGYDPKDATSLRIRREGSYKDELEKPIKGLKAALPKEYLQEGIDSEIRRVLTDSALLLESMGVAVEEVTLPYSDAGLSAYYLISSAEASSNLARFDGIRYGYRPDTFETLEELMVRTRTEGFGSEVKRRIMLGTYALSSGYYDAYYHRAQLLRNRIREQFNDIFADYDIVLGPVTPSLPFVHGEKLDNPLEMYLGDIFTVDVNLAGLPAVSLPAGFTQNGLPVGIQLIGGHLTEKRLLNVAYQIEQALALDLTSPVAKEVL
ncbi:MAG: Asp-tRNA(Asn)/Glu-tRNA(Gln) amidotransferase subunit GatA [Bacillota bacterium]|nr:Asp-tRNA(Asn)/Glu-tRNA(Gln) amidotransferase subunit GatA [Bacillota bacterium]MDW7677812.1 Asp-tRNA(Asn)/Glu-tRNA(Gln) amidotransferase subunit GatA [Bacillota bacterium]